MTLLCLSPECLKGYPRPESPLDSSSGLRLSMSSRLQIDCRCKFIRVVELGFLFEYGSERKS